MLVQLANVVHVKHLLQVAPVAQHVQVVQGAHVLRGARVEHSLHVVPATLPLPVVLAGRRGTCGMLDARGTHRCLATAGALCLCPRRLATLGLCATHDTRGTTGTRGAEEAHTTCAARTTLLLTALATSWLLLRFPHRIRW